MKNRGTTFVIIARALIVLLLAYTAFSKLLDFKRFSHDIHNQEIFPGLAGILVYLLPLSEIAAAFMLLTERTKITGLNISLVLFMVFTGYTVLVVANVFGRIPCPCGGFLKDVSWNAHLIFNLTFLIINLTALLIAKKGGTANKS